MLDAEGLIKFNRRLLAHADGVRRESQMCVLQSSIDRIQRCVEVNQRQPAWALAMARWAAGVGEAHSARDDSRRPR